MLEGLSGERREAPGSAAKQAIPPERMAVVEACRAFFEDSQPKRTFVPGETYVPVTAKQVDGDDLALLIDSCLDMWLTAGRYATEFEAKIATALGRSGKGLLVNSGSSANLLAISSLGSEMLKEFKLRPLEPGDEIITAAAGFPTTVNPILQNGWKPVFVDVDLATLNATIEAIQAARGPRTRAVALAHTLGNPFRADQVAEWCATEGLYLVEDCCDALGASIELPEGPASVGSFGDFATLSFYPAHHITMGEGGAVVPSSGRWKRVAESLRDWGRHCWCEPGKDNTCGKRYGWTLGDLPEGYDHKYTYSSVGYNLKATDMQAALGVSQLTKLDRFVAVRRANWAALNEGVQGSPVLRDALRPIAATEGTRPSWFGFPMICSDAVDRNRLVRFLEDAKIGTRLVFGGNLTKQPAYRNADFRVAGSLEATDRIMDKAFWIGVHPALDSARIAYMLERLEDGVRAQG